MDDSFNYPLSLLEARLKALAAEAGNFTTVSGRLLEILANETSLIDDILAADELARWEASLRAVVPRQDQALSLSPPGLPPSESAPGKSAQTDLKPCYSRVWPSVSLCAL